MRDAACAGRSYGSDLKRAGVTHTDFAALGCAVRPASCIKRTRATAREESHTTRHGSGRRCTTVEDRAGAHGKPGGRTPPRSSSGVQMRPTKNVG